MSDAPEDAPAPHTRPTIAQRLRKMVIVIGLLFAAWIVFAQAIPRGLLPSKPETASLKERESAPPPKLVRETESTEALREKDEQLGAMKERIDQLEAKLKELEAVAAAPKQEGESDETREKIEKMQAKIDALLQMPHTSTINDERVGHLEESISKQQDSLRTIQGELSAVHEKATRDVTIITSFTSLKDAVLRGAAYSSQLALLTPLVSDAKSQEMLSQLKPMADKGIGTQEQLQAEFKALIPKALAAGKGNALQRNLGSLIRIRRVGEQQKGADDEAVIARAEAKLARGDIEGSVKETSALSPAALALFTPWNGKAQELVRVRALMDTLQLSLLQDKPQNTSGADIAPSAGRPETQEEPTPEKMSAPAAAPAPVPVPDAPKEMPNTEAKPDEPKAEEKPAEPAKKPEALPDTKPASTL